MKVTTGHRNYHFQSGLSFMAKGFCAASKSDWDLSTFFTKPEWGMSLKIGDFIPTQFSKTLKSEPK